MSSFAEIPPVAQALIAGIFCWAVGAVGSAVVFFTERVNQKLIDMAEGFASGVMIAACFWSLLEPAIAMTAKMPNAIHMTLRKRASISSVGDQGNSYRR